MRRLLLLVLLLLIGSASAQPLPAETVPGGHAGGDTHFFAELFGSGFLLSFNLDHEVLPHVVARGGLGYAPVWLVGGFPVSGVGGVSYVPFEGTFRPEVGVSAMVLLDDGVEVAPAGFLGTRIHTSDRSMLRLGAAVFYRPDGLDGVFVWPSIGFGGRL